MNRDILEEAEEVKIKERPKTIKSTPFLIYPSELEYVLMTFAASWCRKMTFHAELILCTFELPPT